MRIAARETQIDAFHAYAASGKKEAQQQMILAFIRARGGDWSIGELAQALDMEKSTVSPRLNEMLYDCNPALLVEAPKRKDRISGITVRPVRMPAEQLDLVL